MRDVISDAQHNPVPCKRFINVILDANIFAAALQLFGMTSADDKPTRHGFENKSQSSAPKVLQSNLQEFIQAFVVDGTLYENLCQHSSLAGMEDSKVKPCMQVPRLSQFLQT